MPSERSRGARPVVRTAVAAAGRYRPWSELREAAKRRAPPPLLGKILYLERLTVSFDGFKALNGLTLYVDPGELRCIIGPNGAGKTTMMDVITGKTRPDEGTAWFGQNIDLLSLSEPEIAQAGIGRKFQKPTVFEFLSVFENLELALADDKSFWRTLMARLTPAQRERIAGVLDVIGLTAERQALAGTLSHGQKQWLEIGMLLMQQPELLLVDEPVAGMTPQETERTAELLLSLAGKHTVIVVEHDMDFVRSIASQVTVLHEGRVLAEGDMDRVQNDPQVIEVYLGRMSLLSIKGLNQSYGGSHTLWDVDVDVERRVASRASWAATAWGRPRCSNASWDCCRLTSGTIDLRRDGPAQCAGRRARPPGHRLRAAGTRDLSAADRGGEPSRRAGGAPAACADHPVAGSSTSFPCSKQMLGRRGGDLSGGQQQQLAIGRALVLEPTPAAYWTNRLKASSRTSSTRSATSSSGSIEDAGVTVLLVEQKLPFARRVGSDFRILEKGRCAAGGSIDELSDDIVRDHLSV